MIFSFKRKMPLLWFSDDSVGACLSVMPSCRCSRDPSEIILNQPLINPPRDMCHSELKL